MKLKGPLFVWLTVVRASIASEIQRLIVPIAALTSQVDRGQQGLYGSNWRRGKRQRLQTLSRSSHTDTLENYKIWRPMDYVGKTVGHKAMYLVDVALGNNSQSFRLLVDTGSNSLVIPGKMCRSRTCMFRHLFDASNSTRTNTTMSIQYGLGTLKGHVVKDEVCLGASSDSLTEVSLLQASHQRQALRWRFHGHGYIPHHEAKSLTTRVCARMSFLVANELSDDFAKLPFDGILGLGLPDSRPGANEFSLIEHLNGAGYEVSSKFTLSFGNFGNSQLTLGNVDSTSLLGGQTLWLPLSKASASNWQFPVLDFTLDGHAQHFGSIEVSVDSGTSLLAADDGIRRWLVQQLSPKDCAAVDNLPVLGLQLQNGHALPLFPSDYVDQRVGIQGLLECKLAIMPGHFQSVNGQRLVLGDSFLRRFVTTFDLQNRQIGFGIARKDEFGHVMLPVMFPDFVPAVPSGMNMSPAERMVSSPHRHLRFPRGLHRSRQGARRLHPIDTEFDRIASMSNN